jgi:prepilin-type N-terminal cleavage/methylation domain-containing protein
MHISSQQGFTLIELLVVMTIIAVLTGIALPQYHYYREKSFDTRASADLRNVAVAEEAYFLEAEHYLACRNAACAQLPGIASLSGGVELEITVNNTLFRGKAFHPKGSGKTYHWDSDRGGMLDP